jgi:hypothetical protein
MTVHNLDHTSASKPARSRREAQFKGMLVLDTDEPLWACLGPNHKAVLCSNGSYEERAKELNLPVGTLKSRLHRARVKLAALRGQKQPDLH